MRKAMNLFCRVFTAAVISTAATACFATTFNAFFVFAFCGGLVLSVIFGVFDNN